MRHELEPGEPPLQRAARDVLREGAGLNGDSQDDALTPEDLVNRILLSDAAILGIVAVDGHGNAVASAWKSELPEGLEMSKDEVNSVGSFTGILMGMAMSGRQTQSLRARGSYGRFESVMINHERAKILFLPLPAMKLTLTMRLLRSANSDYITNLVLSRVGVLKWAEDLPGSASAEPRSELGEVSPLGK